MLRALPTADGGQRHEIFLDGRLLMDDAEGRSEAALADVALRRCARQAGLRVLIGGLGFGFTLAAVLRDERVAEVEVVEIEPALVDFVTSAGRSRGFPDLDEPRVHLRVGDVRESIAASSSRFDCVLLDVDNGPDALSAGRNAALYTQEGLGACRSALGRGGALAIWSSEPCPPCLARMSAVFGNAEDVPVPTVREGRRLEYHVLASRRP